MRGATPLIAMRLSGYVPEWVFIDTDPPGRICQADTWHKAEGDNTTAHLQTSDRIERVDVRCVRGLKCYVEGTDMQRVRDMREACVDAGAKRVVACVMERHGEGELVAFRVIGKTDTGIIEQPNTEKANG